MKLCVFPNDPIERYFAKGEIKSRYFNPENIFEEIDIISFTEKDIEEAKVQTTAGIAKLKIHSVGKINLINKSKQKEKVLKLLNEIKPDIIRAYNPLVEGWVAAKCSKKLRVPFFVSLHVQYDGLRNIAKKKSLKKFLALKYTRKFIEPYTLSCADKITAVYKIIDPYVYDLCKRHPEILYNKIDLEQFQKAQKKLDCDKPLVLSVGRLTPQKNHDLIIKAIRNLDVQLLIIGNGELKEELSKLIKELRIENKVIFKDSVPNNQIQDYYKSADVFVLAYDPKIEGVPIPVLEALACGIPIVIPKPVEGLSDGLEKAVIFSEFTSEAFHHNLKKIIEDKDYSQRLSKNSQEKSEDFSSHIIEKREAEIYRELIGGKKSS